MPKLFFGRAACYDRLNIMTGPNMRIRIIKTGIYGSAGAVPVGAEFDVQAIPDAWADRVEIIADAPPADAEPVTNPARRGRPRKEVE